MSKFKLPKLPKRIKDKWVKALRSGKYIQGKGELYSGEVMGKPSCCCLGVLEHVCGTPLEDIKGKGFTQDLSSPKSPKHLRIEDNRGDRVENLFSYMNDGNSLTHSVLGREIKKKMTFNQIAAYIERYM